MTEFAHIPIPDDLSEIIRLKERELHDINEFRCERLEVALLEKEKSISEVLKRFDTLKEDFEYNLSLLGARDQEISRLENVSMKLASDIELKDRENKVSRKRLEASEIQLTELLDSRDREQKETRSIIFEIKEEVESVKWTAEEEVKSKQRELDALRNDLRKNTSSREEAMDSQRRDLTSTFESLIRQRDDEYVAKEKEVVRQVSTLEARFEMILTENMKIKSDLSNAVTKFDLLADESLRREELLRQVQWRLDEERALKISDNSGLQSRLQDALAEASRVKDAMLARSEEAHRNLEKAIAALNQERSLRESLERKLQDSSRAAQSKITELKDKLSTAGDHERIVLSEVNSLQMKIEELQNSEKHMQEQFAQSQSERARVTSALAASQRKLASLLTTYDDLQNQFSAAKAQHVEQLQQVASVERDEIEALQNEVDRLTKEVEKQTTLIQHAPPLDTDGDRQLERVRYDLRKAVTAYHESQDLIERLQSQLRDEQAEAEALRLRLDLRSNEVTDSYV